MYKYKMADRFTLAELKKMIKDHTKTAPKLSSGKQNLLLYADRMGLLKSKEAVEAPPAIKTPAPKVAKELPAALKKVHAKPVAELPASLKKPVEAAPVKKTPTGFAKFLSDNKGQGYTMAQLSELYRQSKE